MKKMYLSMAVALLSITSTLAYADPGSNESGYGAPAPAGQPDSKGFFYIYADKGYPGNHFTPSGWMGDYGDLKIDDSNKDMPKNGTTCVKISYAGKGAQVAGWAGIFWQQP